MWLAEATVIVTDTIIDTKTRRGRVVEINCILCINIQIIRSDFKKSALKVRYTRGFSVKKSVH
jgi:ribosomal protein S27E